MVTAASVRRPGRNLTAGAIFRQVMMTEIFATQSMPTTKIVSIMVYARALLAKTLLLKTLIASFHLVKSATTQLPSITRKNQPVSRPGEILIISAFRARPLKRNRRRVIKSTRTMRTVS